MLAHRRNLLFVTALIGSTICAGVLCGSRDPQPATLPGPGTDFEALLHDCDCPYAVFSAKGGIHNSIGNPDLINYKGGYEFANDSTFGPVVNGAGTFIAPIAGFYVFSFTGEKDTWGAPQGTTDDVYAYICKNGGPTTGTVIALAWGGETPVPNEREQMAATAAVYLAVGETVEVWAHADGIPGKPRTIYYPHFTGFLLRAM